MNELADLPRPHSVNWAPGGTHGLVNYGGNLVVFFYKKPVKNNKKSLEAGRPIFEDVDYIKMHPPGERLNIIDRPATSEDIHKYPEQWHRYLHNQTQIPEGTPVDLLFPNHPSVAESLKSLGVFTVEQLANLSAHAMDTIGMGAQGYVDKAKKYLSNAEKGAGLLQVQKELDDQKRENRVLQQKLELAISQIKALEQKINNPLAASYQPPFIEGYDVQTERINANHPTAEAATQKKRTRKTKEETPIAESDDGGIDLTKEEF